MEARKRFTLIFVLGCIGAAIAACIAIALAGIRLIYWYLGNCGDDQLACSMTSWLIDFWWSLFVPAALVAAVILRRIHDRQLARIAEE